MTTVWEVAKAIEPGDDVIWRGEKADVENPRPSTVTRTIWESGKVTVEAEGPESADDVGFWVRKGGESQVWHGDHEMGPVDGIERVGTDHHTHRFEK